MAHRVMGSLAYVVCAWGRQNGVWGARPAQPADDGVSENSRSTLFRNACPPMKSAGYKAAPHEWGFSRHEQWQKADSSGGAVVVRSLAKKSGVVIRLISESPSLPANPAEGTARRRPPAFPGPGLSLSIGIRRLTSPARACRPAPNGPAGPGRKGVRVARSRCRRPGSRP